MSSEETLFQEALARAPEERAAFLAQACAGQPELRAAVEALLAAHDKSSNLLDKPPADPGQTVDSEPGQPDHGATGEHSPQPDDAPVPLVATTDYHRDAQPGAVIAGRYTLVEKIGEGGMGEVWVAKQTEPVKRKIALKLIKTGMDSKAVLARFEQERQALAMMDHPNIARVLDGGMTPTGQPFFVMELVNGMPLTKFCDEAKLTPKQRLELFVPICQAVQHAHQKGIVHRDLKPANILVTLIDARPVPKVIDFGVAKATGGKLTNESMATQFGAIVGTLEYMAPEQAGFAGIDIDTRADIYSLGVILYELLTGLRPIDAKRLKKAALTELIRIIQEEEPSKPSTRLSTDESLPSLAALRQTEPKRLMALLRGELDCVVLKCLEKQRERRYETASGLARDIQRFLADEVVEARPPSAGYRLKKFVRRHKGQVIAASLVLVALLVGIAGTTFGLLRAEQQRDIAERAAEAERLAKLEAQEERANALKAAEAEKAANAQAQKRLAQIEKANAILGSIFENLDPKEIAKAERPLQAILVEKLDQAVAQLEGESIGDPLVVAAMQVKFGNSLLGLGEPGKAIVLLEKAHATRQAMLGLEHYDTLAIMSGLARAYLAAGKLDLAVSVNEKTLKLTKAKLGPEHPDTLISMNNLADAYYAAGKRDLALPLFEETLKLHKAKLGPEHPNTLMSMNNLAKAYKSAGKLDLALPLYEETLKLRRAKLGPEHPDTLMSMNNLALAYQGAGKLDLALPLLEETLKLQNAKLGPEHPDTLTSMNNLALAYYHAGKLDLALPLMEETLKLRKAKRGPDHPDTISSMGSLGHLYCLAGQGEKAAAILKEFIAGNRKRSPPNSPRFARLLAQVALDLSKAGQYPTAEEMLRECLAILQKTQPEVWGTFNTQSLLGGALLGQKKYADAEPLLLNGYEGMKKQEAKIPAPGKLRLVEAALRLVQLYEATGKKDEAARWRSELKALKTAQKKLEKQP